MFSRRGMGFSFRGLLSFVLSKRTWVDSKAGTLDRMVLRALADFANDQNQCWPSNEAIMRLTRLSERRVREAVENLIALGELKRELQAGPGRCNLFTITLGRGHDTPPEPGIMRPLRGHNVPKEGAQYAPEYIREEINEKRNGHSPPVLERWKLERDIKSLTLRVEKIRRDNGQELYEGRWRGTLAPEVRAVVEKHKSEIKRLEGQYDDAPN